MANPIRTALQYVLVYGYTIFVMLGMGASIDVDIVAEVKKAPKAVLCGVASQYCFMPFVAWSLSLLFDLGTSEALAVVLIGMCPGGVTSTLFTYLSHANVTLSLVMTTCSTFVALLMIPLLLFIYVRPPLISKGEDGADVSFAAVVVTLLVATVPAIVGWRLRRSNPELGEKVEKFATKLGSLLIFGVLVFAFAWPGPGGYGMTAKCFAVMVLMCPCGFLLGYGFGLACGMDQITCRTISMETGIQQVGIAGAIAIQSFEDDQLDRTIVVMVMFGVATVIFGALWALILRKAFDPPAAKLDPSDDKTVDPSAIALGDKGFDDHDV